MAQAARVLAGGGRLAFSVEGGGPDDGYSLDPSGRYTHADGYVRSMARVHGLSLEASSAETIRAERGNPVPGRLYVLAQGA
jgi:predicted TPR repeat methyltransferase